MANKASPSTRAKSPREKYPLDTWRPNDVDTATLQHLCRELNQTKTGVLRLGLAALRSMNGLIVSGNKVIRRAS